MKANNRVEAIRYAIYFVTNQTTVRKVAKQYGVSKTRVHNMLVDITNTNFKYEGNQKLALAVRQLLDKNKSERHIRGGNATKLKYMKKEENKQ